LVAGGQFLADDPAQRLDSGRDGIGAAPKTVFLLRPLDEKVLQFLNALHQRSLL
jgi:hypothetical protein